MPEMPQHHLDVAGNPNGLPPCIQNDATPSHSSCKCCLMLCTGLDQYTCKDVLSLAQCRMPGLSDNPLQDWTSIHQGAVQEAFQFLSERFHVAPWSQEDTQQLHQRALLVAQAWCCPAHTPCLHA